MGVIGRRKGSLAKKQIRRRYLKCRRRLCMLSKRNPAALRVGTEMISPLSWKLSKTPTLSLPSRVPEFPVWRLNGESVGRLLRCQRSNPFRRQKRAKAAILAISKRVRAGHHLQMNGQLTTMQTACPTSRRNFIQFILSRRYGPLKNAAYLDTLLRAISGSI